MSIHKRKKVKKYQVHPFQKVFLKSTLTALQWNGNENNHISLKRVKSKSNIIIIVEK